MEEGSPKMTHLSSISTMRKGGLRTMPFIILNESFEKVASYGLMPNMIFYLMKDYHLDAATGTTILLLWSATSNALAMVGAFLSDSCLGRFRVIALGSFSSLLGMIMLWLTAMVPETKPSPFCNPSNGSCKSSTAAQLGLLFSSFGLMSIGAGCIRPCSIAFGADQLIKKGDPNNEGLLQSFFNWFYASTGVSTILALTVIVYIQEHLGWKVGFAVPAFLMLIASLLFLMGSPLYIKVKASKSLFTGFFQVLVVAFKNRNLSFPTNNSIECYHQAQDSELIKPTKNLRFLNKACIIGNQVTDVKPDSSPSNPWKLCTVDQVESLKSLLRVVPIWSSCIIVQVIINQSTFTAIQASTMNRHITSHFQIPAGSFSVFLVLTLTIWVAMYDRLIVPLMAKHMGKPHGLSQNQRMGIGILVSVAAMAVSAGVERVRRRMAIREGLADNAFSVVDMSAMWLVPQQCLIGLAEAINAVAQIEFYYSHFSKNMASMAMALFTLGMAAGNLVGSLIVKIVDGITKGEGKDSWLSSNPNKGHYDYFYWLLAIVCLVDMLYFLVCCWAYGSDKEEETKLEGGTGASIVT
ncbi:protein NRT1/ PTR FAMILY 1.2-like [Macadamia integrifolia]|uniref:protein NRT1/ PTR FAMILY 1.2-like n=1 Tax=Macadamia integrifolia TaxID=60698 RepID=UPI001C4F0F7E|nr:protein NRT1/ PTR FAMILY 1.2-like [Macadamia integrifolia]XP_042486558.1 protein NRT1/ PTR FAMILY 1.2-like [Macadamia integrifolia]